MALTNKDREWIERHFECFRNQLLKLSVDIATLKVKASVWGLAGGLIPVLGVALYFLITGFLGK